MGELQRENQRLAAENRELARELDHARQRIAELERQIARLVRELEAARRGEPVGDSQPPKEPGSVDETDPSASPRALFRALVKSYEQAMDDAEIGAPRSRERAAYVRLFTQWRNDVQRQHRAQIEWHVRVEQVTPAAGGYRMRLVAIDPKNKEELGAAFEISVSRAQARRYEQLAVRDEVGLFVLRGTLTPNVRINEERMTPGPFDNPPLIGPFAEFGFMIDVRAFMPAGDTED